MPSTAHADMQAEAVDLLLKWGADCKLEDTDGVAPIDTARHFPEILAAMHQKQVLVTSYVTGSSALSSGNSVCTSISPAVCLLVCNQQQSRWYSQACVVLVSCMLIAEVKLLLCGLRYAVQ